jgi:anti-anti-sigma factor
MLTVIVENLGDEVILWCHGKIVHGSETAILCPAVRQHGPSVILDLTKVDVIDAAGVGALIALQAAGIYVKLVNPAKQVREILRVVGLESVFEIGQTRMLDEVTENCMPGSKSASMPQSAMEAGMRE